MIAPSLSQGKYFFFLKFKNIAAIGGKRKLITLFIIEFYHNGDFSAATTMIRMNFSLQKCT